jgi:hypothetical protein
MLKGRWRRMASHASRRPFRPVTSSKVIVAIQVELNLHKAHVKKNALTRRFFASPRRYRTFRIVIAARYPRFARMRAAVCHHRVILRCMRPLGREAADFATHRFGGFRSECSDAGLMFSVKHELFDCAYSGSELRHRLLPIWKQACTR